MLTSLQVNKNVRFSFSIPHERHNLECVSLKVRKVLTGERKDGGSVFAREGGVVCSGGFVTVRGTPDVDVGGHMEVEDGLYGLVSGTVLAETNGIVGGDPDDLVLAESGQPHSTSGVGNEVLAKSVRETCTRQLRQNVRGRSRRRE